MVSAPVKDFLINLLIASLLATSVLLGLFFKDKIIDYFSKRPKVSKMVFEGPTYKVKDAVGSKEGFQGIVIEIDDRRVVIEKDGKRQTLFVDGSTKLAVFDSEALSLAFEEDKETRGISSSVSVELGEKFFTEFAEVDDVITVPKFREEGGNFLAEEVLIFKGHKEMLFE